MNEKKSESCNNQEKFELVLSKYKGKSSDELISLLQEVQDSCGLLNKENMKEIAHCLNLPSSTVYGVATFYNQFRLEKHGKHLIQVCRGTACHVKGSKDLLDFICSELKIKEGETTSDGVFTLETVMCLGACSIAPIVVIDGQFFGKMTKERILPLLKKFGYNNRKYKQWQKIKLKFI